MIELRLSNRLVFAVVLLSLVVLSFFVPQADNELACHFNANRINLTENQNPESY